jgi:acetoin utilization deacetylase AcuC-like enzyme
MTTGWLWHERFGWHDTGTAAGFLKGEFIQPLQHVESPESKARFASLIEVSGIAKSLRRIECVAATEEDILRVHQRQHLDKMKSLGTDIRGGDMGDGVSPFGFGGFELALLAAGGTMSALRAVVEAEVNNAYALVRPPGHHARPDTGMGFCMFSNIAVAIAYAKAKLGIERVAVVDWDVHHGNGTEACFETDPSVLTISLHQDGNFPPDTGKVTHRGSGRGEGSAINIPLPAGSGEGAYLHAVDRVVIPAIQRFKPELIMVASGFDASNADPLGRMMLMASSYAKMTRKLMDLAAAECGGRLVASHEGGYSPFYVPFCGLAVVETLSGVKTGVEDPYQQFWANLPGQELQENQKALVALVAETCGL